MPTPDNSRYADLLKYATMNQVSIDSAKDMANRKLWEFLIMGGGLGLTSGALFGATRMLAQPKPPTPSPTYQSVDLMLPEAKKKNDVKTANVVDWLAKNVTGPAVRESKSWDGPAGFFMGNKATNWWEVPALWSIAGPGALGLAYGGHKAMSGVSDQARQMELDEKMDNTRKKYKQLVQESLTAKHANDQTLEAELDELADLHEKRSSLEESAWHIPNVAGSFYLPYALISALASGKFTYDYFKKNSPQKIQEAAMQRRAKERNGGVAPIYLEPTTQGPV